MCLLLNYDEPYSPFGPWSIVYKLFKAAHMLYLKKSVQIVYIHLNNVNLECLCSCVYLIRSDKMHFITHTVQHQALWYTTRISNIWKRKYISANAPDVILGRAYTLNTLKKQWKIESVCVQCMTLTVQTSSSESEPCLLFCIFYSGFYDSAESNNNLQLWWLLICCKP